MTTDRLPEPEVSMLSTVLSWLTVSDRPELTRTLSTPAKSLALVKLRASTLPSSTISVPPAPKLMTLPASSMSVSLSSDGRSNFSVPAPDMSTLTKTVVDCVLPSFSTASTPVALSDPTMTVTEPAVPVMAAVLLAASIWACVKTSSPALTTNVDESTADTPAACKSTVPPAIVTAALPRSASEVNTPPAVSVTAIVPLAPEVEMLLRSTLRSSLKLPAISTAPAPEIDWPSKVEADVDRVDPVPTLTAKFVPKSPAKETVPAEPETATVFVPDVATTERSASKSPSSAVSVMSPDPETGSVPLTVSRAATVALNDPAARDNSPTLEIATVSAVPVLGVIT